MEKKLQGSLRTLLDEEEEEEKPLVNPEKRIEYVSIWDSLPRQVHVKKNSHLPKHHDSTKVSAFTKFNLLLCKELKLMTRKKLLLWMETLVPILIIVAFNFHVAMVNKPAVGHFYTPFLLGPLEMKECDNVILIAPDFTKSPVTKKLAEILNNDAGVKGSDIRFEQHTDMKHISQQIGKTCGTVHFTNPEIIDIKYKNGTLKKAGELPKHMHYQIRLRSIQWSLIAKDRAFQEPSKWETQRVYPREVVIGARNKEDNNGGTPGYQSEGFLFLQRVIDNALTKMTYEKRCHHCGGSYRNNMFLQLSRFPYPKFQNAGLVAFIQKELPFYLLAAYFFLIVVNAFLAVKEKESGAKGFLHSFRISNLLHWLPFMTKNMIQYSMVNFVITCLLCTGWYEDVSSHVAVIESSTPSLIFVLLELITFNTLSFSCLISVFFDNPYYAASTAGFYWIFLNLPFLYFDLRNFPNIPIGIQYFASLFAQTGLKASLQYIAIAENIYGVQWNSIFENEFNLGNVFIMLAVGGILCILLAIYLENVFPSSTNRQILPLPWLYPFTGWWWKGYLPPDKHDAPEKDDNDDNLLYTEFFEENPLLLKQELQIKQLCKVYPGDVGVFNISMNFFEGEITVMLGTEGSGKSTLWGLIGGLISPTKGTMFLNNLNVRTEAKYIKYNVGLCPEQDYLYDYLTVEEHISFYAQLKGMTSITDALDETNTLMNELQLKSARSKLISEITLSEKRLVHIAIAFCAGCKVVLLDEPSARADASTKRIIWKFFHRQKINRTIIVFTKDCEETNYIGDRISVLVNGELQCRGSLDFLKSKYGGGYHLTLYKGENFKFFDITNLVKFEIPCSRVENETKEYISYYLPGGYMPKFAKLLEVLETRLVHYDIKNITMNYVSMDEVFQMVCNMAIDSNNKTLFKQRRSLSKTSVPEIDVEAAGLVTFPTDTVLANSINQFTQLLKKNIKLTFRRLTWLAIPVCLSIIMILGPTQYIKSNTFHKNLPALNLTLAPLKKYIEPKFLVQCAEKQYDENSFCNIVIDVARKYCDIDVVDDREFNTDIDVLIVSSYRKKRTVGQGNLFLAVRFDHGGTLGSDTKLTVYFNNQPLHVAPVAVNFASNLILAAAMQRLKKSGEISKTTDVTDFRISVENFPLEYQTTQVLGLTENYWSSGFYLGLTFTWAMTFFMPYFIVFPVREKFFKHIQVVCGVSLTIYWMAQIIWAMVMFTLMTSIMFSILHLMGAIKWDGRKDQGVSKDYLQLFLLFEMFGFATIGMINCMVPLFRRSGLNGYLYACLLLFMTGPFPMSMILITTEQYRGSHKVSAALKTIHEILLIFPSCALGLGVFNIYARYKYATECTQEAKMEICKISKNHGCCFDDPFFHSERGFGIGENIIFLLIVGLGAHIWTFYMETDSFRRFKIYLTKKTILPKICCCDKTVKVHVVEGDDLPEIDFGDQNNWEEEDDDDNMEYEIVLKNILKQTESGEVILHIPKLRLKSQECTCCFGVDGSGKRTLLKILAGLIIPDMGDVEINNKSLLNNYSEYIKQISYSPDHETYLSELTAKETLDLCGIFSNIPKSSLESAITTVCLKLNLFDELENKVGDFSPGTIRKLALAIAIINQPEILVLEEPTTDVDPQSRLQIIQALTELKATSSILISTSDMDLCEQICDRIFVLVNGRICCYGSPDFLKKTYCEANTISAKLIPEAPQFYLPGNVVDLGWDYDNDESDENEEGIKAKNDRDSGRKSFGGKSSGRRSYGGKSQGRSLASASPRGSASSMRSIMLAGNVRMTIRDDKSPIHIPGGAPKGSILTPRGSFGGSNKVAPESVFPRGSAPRGSIFGNLFSIKNLPKYEYHSSSSSSDTFTSTTRMEHWQVELIPLMNFIETQFPEAELINTYPCFVQYLLRKKSRYSEIFQKMEIAKKHLDVEHFSAGHMSLDQFIRHYIAGQKYKEIIHC